MEQVGFGEDKSGKFYNLYANAEMYFSLAQLDSSLLFAQRALGSTKAFGDLDRESQYVRFLNGKSFFIKTRR